MDRDTRLSYLLVAPLVAGILIAAALCTWHSPFCVDNRTYLEMMQGIVRHGLPIVDNGPAYRFPELQIRWDQVGRGGHLWGSYAPVYPYLAAPLYAMGGARLVTQANIAALALLALGVFQLARRLTRNPLAGTAAAYLVLGATHIWTFSFDVSPYTTMLTAATWSLVLLARALDDGPSAGLSRAFAAGFLAALASGAHMLAAPVLTAVLLLAFVVSRDGESPLPLPAWTGTTRIHAWVPSREAILRGSLALVGTALVMVPIAVLNKYRFGSASPMSTGGCVWFTCRESNLVQQGLGAMLRFNAPALLWAAVAGAAVLAVRRSRIAVSVVAVAALCALIPPSKLHSAAFGIGTLFTAFVLDVSLFDIGLWRPPDHFGVFLGPHAIKSLLQSSPVVAVALAGVYASRRDRRIAWIIGLPAIAVLASLVLRGQVTLLYAIGYPYMDLRYVTPMLPFLVALVVAAVHRMGWRPRHLVLLVGLSLVAFVWCARAPNDVPYMRRLVILRGTLVAAAMAYLATVYARVHDGALVRAAARGSVVVAVALAVGVDLGIDLRGWISDRRSHDAISARIGAVTPQKFALLGVAGPGGIDPASSLRVSRDLQYADIGEVWGDFNRFRRLVDYWESEQRPVFVVIGPGFVSPWPDYTAELRDSYVSLYRLRHR